MTETTVSSSEEQQPRPAYARLALTIVLAPYAIPLLRHPESGSFLDGIDLAIHATGHLVFGPFGEVIAAAGGTLFQLIVPAALVPIIKASGEACTQSAWSCVSLPWRAESGSPSRGINRVRSGRRERRSLRDRCR